MRLQKYFNISLRHLFPHQRTASSEYQSSSDDIQDKMPTTEQVFYEARARPNSTVLDRRPSIVIDESGCVIQRGFMIPSRSSSQSSLARTPTNSSIATDGTPASPIECPRPGYARPTGSLYDAPEFAALRTKSASSLCPPSEHLGGGGAGHPGRLERRQTWQLKSARSSSNASSRWNDDDLEDTKCKTASATYSSKKHLAAPVAVPLQRPAVPYQARAMSRLKNAVHARRTKSEQVDHKDVAQKKNHQTQLERTKTDEKNESDVQKNSHVTLVAKADAEDAIASDDDGEPEDGIYADIPGLLKSGIAAQRCRPSYATRRAISDAKAEEMKLNDDAPLVMLKPRTYGPAPSHADDPKAKSSQQLQMVCGSQAEDAIASDDDDDDDDEYYKNKMNVALGLAQLHRSRNSITVKIDEPAEKGREGPNTAEAKVPDAANPVVKESLVESTHKRKTSAGLLTVKIVQAGETQPTKAGASSDNVESETPVETPIEVKSFKKGSQISARELPPSREQRTPPKGVLKKDGSPPPPPNRHARTCIKQGTGQVVNGRVLSISPPRASAAA